MRRVHSGSNDATYGDIAKGEIFTISGPGDVKIKGGVGDNAQIIKNGSGDLVIVGVVGNNVQLQIAGPGDVVIKDRVGDNAQIRKDGSGDLSFNGVVGEDIAIKMTGPGDLKFAKKPPESTVSQIQHSGSGDIHMPGGYNLAPKKDLYRGNVFSGSVRVICTGGKVIVTCNGTQTVYRGGSGSLINGQVYIDGTEAGPADPRIISSCPEGQAQVSAAAGDSNANAILQALWRRPAPSSSALRASMPIHDSSYLFGSLFGSGSSLSEVSAKPSSAPLSASCSDASLASSAASAQKSIISDAISCGASPEDTAEGSAALSVRVLP